MKAKLWSLFIFILRPLPGVAIGVISAQIALRDCLADAVLFFLGSITVLTCGIVFFFLHKQKMEASAIIPGLRVANLCPRCGAQREFFCTGCNEPVARPGGGMCDCPNGHTWRCTNTECKNHA